MTALLSRRSGPGLEERLEALRTVVEEGRDRLPEDRVDAARSVLDRAGERMGLGMEWTVVALAGSTGSGKSSLFNALSGAELSQVGVRRPTTGTAHASVWAQEPPAHLLDWLGVPRRHNNTNAELEGLVLLDLPDHDSTEIGHRVEVDRLAELVDVFVWVVDPQKYADAALHHGYLRPLATHAAVSIVVLNQIDRLSEAERRACMRDVARLLKDDGMRDVRVLSTSARSGEGLAELRDVILERVKEERAALERLGSDIDRVSLGLAGHCEGKPAGLSKTDVRRLNEALAGAAQVPVVTDAVAKAHRRDAGLAMGWPFSRWVRRFRPDPLARLHLRREPGAGRTSLSEPSPLQKAQVERSLRAVSASATEGLGSPWPEIVHERVARRSSELLEELDHAVARTDLGVGERPRWWVVASFVQTLLAVAAILGFLWLTVLFALEWFQVPRPPTPETENIPWPTILLGGGLLAGFLLSIAFAQLARVGAARRRDRARRRLTAEVSEVAKTQVVDPIEGELAAYSSLCAALARLKR